MKAAKLFEPNWPSTCLASYGAMERGYLIQHYVEQEKKISTSIFVAVLIKSIHSFSSNTADEAKSHIRSKVIKQQST